jgi:outer membrane protein OmpA-like peptidoglycan-associated protein
MKTSSSWLVTFLIASLTLAGSATAAHADEPVVGAELSVAIPLKGTADTADVGGAAGVYVGYQIGLADNLHLALLANPEIAFFPSDKPVNPSSGRESDSDAVGLLALQGGPRLTIDVMEVASVFLDGRGGYTRDLSGPLNSSGANFAVGGGAAFEVAEATSVTLFGRYNEAFRRAERNSHENFRYVNIGLGLEYRFLAPQPVAQAAAPAPTPAPAPPPVKKRLILRGVNFDFDKANIRPDARPVLDEAIHTLKAAGDVRVSVEGHTDSVGSDAYNQRLSVRRANAVADYLAKGGITASRMEVSGFGESQPVASNDTADGRAQNRRVELNVIGQ